MTDKPKVTQADWEVLPEVDRLRKRAKQLLKLEKGWDGYLANPPLPKAVNDALKFAELLVHAGAPIVQMTPASDTSVMVSTAGEDEATFDFTGEPNKTASIVAEAFKAKDARHRIEAEQSRDDVIEEAVSEWQPIETAPKDGTYILVSSFHEDGIGGFYEYGGHPKIAAWQPTTRRQKLSNYRVDWRAPSGRRIISEGYGSPTHWANLPPPPWEQALRNLKGKKS